MLGEKSANIFLQRNCLSHPIAAVVPCCVCTICVYIYLYILKKSLCPRGYCQRNSLCKMKAILRSLREGSQSETSTLPKPGPPDPSAQVTQEVLLHPTHWVNSSAYFFIYIDFIASSLLTALLVWNFIWDKKELISSWPKIFISKETFAAWSKISLNPLIISKGKKKKSAWHYKIDEMKGCVLPRELDISILQITETLGKLRDRKLWAPSKKFYYEHTC